MQEAMFWRSEENNSVHCELCPKHCTIRPGKTGFCRVRKNVDGKLYTLNFNRVAAHAMDPIEKKPLYHYYPGQYILSLGTTGCNLRCGFCQNWTIAHADPQTIEVTPEHVAEVAAKQDPYPNVGIAYTYSEPFMWYEFVFHTARLAREKGLKNVLVTNGYINEEPLKALLPYIDAMNIDVKAFTDNFYRKNCTGHLEPVMRTVEMVHSHCHVELTTLLVPGLNDSEEEIRKLVDWVAALDPEIPLHFSRYFPNFEFELDPTPPEALKRAQQIALEKLDYVYIGNLGDPRGMNTYCPRCGKIVINRTWYNGKVVGLTAENNCKHCGRKIKVIR
ncbi:pyruvate formate lyase activating enzyme [Desulfohalotomaculum tongense]|uniref:AmmeMemoRadiSam system radical SAM enzyme n=1 Tax=Desulforadius tongensis TaxID=1216062 RepID=UPI00195A484F|nr:AmmeMemoRadiSam system radical SAM enzyme [Desulforadius tongensis]MBM7853869.1 pyruvate formate lyase activating enzyme [Desulforadius tongensis]